MRPTWDEYFLKIATVVAERSTCNRAHVGAVLVKENVIVSCGYNGAPTGKDHCDDVGHDMSNGHCIRTIHAEMNALRLAPELHGGETLYVTHTPCIHCQEELKAFGVGRIVAATTYP